MADYQILFSKSAQKDIAQLTSQQKAKLKQILQDIISKNPYLGKSLKGQLEGLYSYRLNRKDRIVYEILETDKVVFIIRTKTHYGD
ncbi:Similar to tr/Q5NZB9/Q5NZB9 [Planktothrix sp. PCC 11201]|uniref:type II toxin-antitoxin system mRNA interferase toxin, RelE/StbE family n=1 Tax=Planktothrix sp. PCC 11201 TaxID=1729650 RepID=UPI00090F8E90|nr:type II toxin-antitoxin system mRNA interferase toxin, RelE/StbE family [Planktothrix sp. PCC 11201]SKB15114.1 Similar to tr/Q5NZB9/Q5NZB9 [Planktothrix sp. PCC 11201]